MFHPLLWDIGPIAVGFKHSKLNGIRAARLSQVKKLPRERNATKSRQNRSGCGSSANDPHLRTPVPLQRIQPFTILPEGVTRYHSPNSSWTSCPLVEPGRPLSLV